MLFYTIIGIIWSLFALRMQYIKYPETKSLRNCVKAFQQSKIYRLTKEWDDLIQLDETFIEFSKEVLELNNWFIAHQLSAYQKADETTKAHLDNLYLEFNKKWKELLQKYKVKE